MTKLRKKQLEIIEDLLDSKLIEEVMDEPEIPFDELKRKMEHEKKWAIESESRIEGYLNGTIKSIPYTDVLDKINQMK